MQVSAQRLSRPLGSRPRTGAQTSLAIRQRATTAKPNRAVVRATAMASTKELPEGTQVATFALGCKKLNGVLKTRVGYTGGNTPNPTYTSVCGGDGHTEALRVWFDPDTITYEQLLQKFFEDHNPTQRDKAQYKSAIWYHDEAQKRVAESMIAELETRYKCKIATTLDPVTEWTDAEDYHQDYLNQFATSRW